LGKATARRQVAIDPEDHLQDVIRDGDAMSAWIQPTLHEQDQFFSTRLTTMHGRSRQIRCKIVYYNGCTPGMHPNAQDTQIKVVLSNYMRTCHSS
jgi:hypothetical protein